jgi:2'-5' RNA ligase
MRLFIGVELPDSARDAAAAAGEDLRRRVSPLAPRAEIRWVEPANLHVTLWFIGETRDPAVESLLGVMRTPFETAAFELQFARFGAFPENGRPRVLWMGVAQGCEQLTSVHAEVRNRLVALDYEPERRSFSPHLTLARVKDMHPSDAPRVRKALASASPVLDPFPADHVTLFCSHTSPRGARYESLLRVPLR